MRPLIGSPLGHLKGSVTLTRGFNHAQTIPIRDNEPSKAELSLRLYQYARARYGVYG